LKVEGTLLEISTVIVVGKPHCPANGVNVYTVEPIAEVLITEGDHVPAIGDKLLELGGNTPGEAFKQYGPSCVNVGVGGFEITIPIVETAPHCPAKGVNV
jgi:hypothetical protein